MFISSDFSILQHLSDHRNRSVTSNAGQETYRSTNPGARCNKPVLPVCMVASSTHLLNISKGKGNVGKKIQLLSWFSKISKVWFVLRSHSQQQKLQKAPVAECAFSVKAAHNKQVEGLT